MEPSRCPLATHRGDPDLHLRCSLCQIHIASEVPNIASNNRLSGTPDDYKAISQTSLSLFGTYTVDEDKKTVS